MRGCSPVMTGLGVSVAAAVLAAAVAGAPTPPAPRTAELPDGFGKATFGMSVEQVRRSYPGMKPAVPGTGAAYFNSPNLTRYTVAPAKVPGLPAPANVEFRFWKNKLWVVIVYYGGNPFSDIAEDFYRRYGKSTSEGLAPTWVGPKTTILTAPDEMWYSVADNRITKDAQAALVEALQAQRAGRPAAPSAPAPLPTAAPNVPAAPR